MLRARACKILLQQYLPLTHIPVATENLVRLQMTTQSANGAIILDTHDWSGDLERLQQF
jgi:hypothetical protein